MRILTFQEQADSMDIGEIEVSLKKYERLEGGNCGEETGICTAGRPAFWNDNSTECEGERRRTPGMADGIDDYFGY